MWPCSCIFAYPILFFLERKKKTTVADRVSRICSQSSNDLLNKYTKTKGSGNWLVQNLLAGEAALSTRKPNLCRNERFWIRIFFKNQKLHQPCCLNQSIFSSLTYVAVAWQRNEATVLFLFCINGQGTMWAISTIYRGGNSQWEERPGHHTHHPPLEWEKAHTRLSLCIACFFKKMADKTTRCTWRVVSGTAALLTPPVSDYFKTKLSIFLEWGFDCLKNLRSCI